MTSRVEVLRDTTVAGYRAFHNGRGIETNPWTGDEERCKAWERGWCDGYYSNSLEYYNSKVDVAYQKGLKDAARPLQLDDFTSPRMERGFILTPLSTEDEFVEYRDNRLGGSFHLTKTYWLTLLLAPPQPALLPDLPTWTNPAPDTAQAAGVGPNYRHHTHEFGADAGYVGCDDAEFGMSEHRKPRVEPSAAESEDDPDVTVRTNEEAREWAEARMLELARETQYRVATGTPEYKLAALVIETFEGGE